MFKTSDSGYEIMMTIQNAKIKGINKKNLNHQKFKKQQLE